MCSERYLRYLDIQRTYGSIFLDCLFFKTHTGTQRTVYGNILAA